MPPTPDELLGAAYGADPAALEGLAGRSARFGIRLGGEWVDWRYVEWARGGVQVYRLLASNGHGPDERIYVHSKLGIVDDGYTVGSSNTSYQSFVQDSEANVAIDGEAEVLAMAAKVWPPMVGEPGSSLGDRTPEGWLARIEELAWGNQERRANGVQTAWGLVLPWEPWE